VIVPKASVEIPAWIAGLSNDGLGAITSASRLGWGFRNESWKVVLADGRALAITRLADVEAADTTIANTALLHPRLKAAGVAVPAIVDLENASSAGLLVTEFVAGTAGAELLGSPDGAALIGSLLGATWRRLGAVDPTGLRRSGPWEDPVRLAEVAMARLGSLQPPLSAEQRAQLVADISAVRDLLADREPGFVHGDLVPVNMIVGPDRTLAALLDLEDARVADPLLDAGWFDLIVGYHHPSSQAASWAGFVVAAALDDQKPLTRALLRILPELRLLEMLDEPTLSAEAASHLMRLLRFSLDARRMTHGPGPTVHTLDRSLSIEPQDDLR
jgi:aminoglycoside phosphotransferase (APT) family kinase protein